MVLMQGIMIMICCTSTAQPTMAPKAGPVCETDPLGSTEFHSEM